MDASIPSGAARLLDLIGETEAPNGYGTVYANRQNQLPKRLTEMTIAEVIRSGPDWSRRFGSSAAGRYQFINSTLKGLKESEGVAGDALFNGDLQDRLAFVLLEGCGYRKFADRERSVAEFGLALAKTWASFPVLQATHGRHRRVERGETYYAGDRLNRALISPEAVEEVLREIRGQRTSAGFGVDGGMGDRSGQSARSEGPDGAHERGVAAKDAPSRNASLKDLANVLRDVADRVDDVAGDDNLPRRDREPDASFGLTLRDIIRGRLPEREPHKPPQDHENAEEATERHEERTPRGATGGDADRIHRLVEIASSPSACATVREKGRQGMVRIYGVNRRANGTPYRRARGTPWGGSEQAARDARPQSAVASERLAGRPVPAVRLGF